MQFNLNVQVDRLNRATIEEWLLVSSGFSMTLLFARILMTNSVALIFLPWNLMLAFIPFFITNWLKKSVHLLNTWKFWPVMMVWILFIPNSFYILTDLFHLNRKSAAPIWFDLLLIFSFAWIGMIAGLLSMRQLELLWKRARGKSFSVVWIFAIMWLCSFGIYIGRFLRFNSWDVITDPFSLASEIIELVIHPISNKYIWGMTFCYAVFMTLVYFTTKKLKEV